MRSKLEKYVTLNASKHNKIRCLTSRIYKYNNFLSQITEIMKIINLI